VTADSDLSPLVRPRIATGLNHNLRHNGRLYHVQTECCMIRGELYVQTVVFQEGAVLYKTEEPCPQEMTEQRQRAQRSHKKTMVMLLSKPREAASPDVTPAPADLTPNPLALNNPAIANNPATVDRARSVLVDLTTTPGFRAMGLFTSAGRTLSFVSNHDCDIQTLGRSLTEVLGPLRSCMSSNALGVLDALELRSAMGTLVLMSFERLIGQYGGDLIGTLNHVLVLVAPETPTREFKEKTRSFMQHIVAGLEAFPCPTPP
jgi:hypothetical protein